LGCILKMSLDHCQKIKRNYSLRSCQGVTLVELLITLIVLGVLIAVAVPSFERMIRSNRLVAETHELLGNLNLARSEATRRGVNVTLCPSSDGNACANGTDWSGGWLMAVDNAGGSASPQLGEILRRGSSRVPISGPAASRIRFDPTGALLATDVEQIELHDGAQNQYRCLNIALSGRVRSESGSCSS